MTWSVAPLALAVAVTVNGAPPRLTHAEGDVSASPTGVRTASGRAEIALADRSLVHVDTSTTLGYLAGAGLRLEDGRVVVRAAGAVGLDSPSARIEVDARTVAIVLVDRPGGRLLVSVPIGAVTLRTRYASITRIVSGQSAMMTSATSLPWATPYTRVHVDAFTLWSDARAAATGVGVAAGDWVASDLSGVGMRTTPPCTGYPSWTAPCWVLPAGPKARHHSGGALPPPSAPSFAPSYAPSFNTRPSPPPPAASGPRSTSRQAPPTPYPPAAKPTPAPPPQPAPPPGRGNSGAVRGPERPPTP